MNERARGDIGEVRRRPWLARKAGTSVRVHPGLAKATEVFRGLPLREQASILRAQAENPRFPPERRANTLRLAQNAEKLANWHDKQSQETPGQNPAARQR